MQQFCRRDMLRWSVAGAVAAACPALHAADDADSAPASCSLSIGTYAMPGMPVEKAIALVGKIGYDGIELAVRPDFDAAPGQMPKDRRRRVARLLGDTGLRLPALMEHLYPSEADREHAEHLERLTRVTELARDLGGPSPPLVQTVLGGGKWEEKRAMIRDRVGDWVEVFRKAGVVLAVKPHRGGVMSQPAEAVWLIEQLDNSPWLRMVYDYSHYALRDLSVEQTVATALPVTAYVVVKDAVEEDGRVRFKLPGESGTFDYARLLRMFYDGGYRGSVCCEVSSQVSKQPGYQPGKAARICYRNMAAAFDKAGVPRS